MTCRFHAFRKAPRGLPGASTRAGVGGVCRPQRAAWLVLAALGLPTVTQDSSAASPAPEIHVVTGHRAGATNTALPYAIDVLSSTRLARRFARSVPDALADTPGVLVQKTAHGQGSPYIRGFTGYRTLALVDGIRYNNSIYRDGPNEYFALIDPESVARIEVLSGPASVRYGSDAVGGVISVETERADYTAVAAGEFFQHAAQQVRFGSADRSHLARSEVMLGSGQRWGLRAGYSWKDFGDVRAAEIGRQPRTGYGERAVDARLDVALAPAWTLTGMHQRLAQDDVWRTHATVFGRSFEGTTVGSDLVRTKDQHRTLSYLRLDGAPDHAWLAEARFTLSHQAWQEDGERVRGDRRRLFERLQSHMTGVEAEFVSALPWLDLHYGADYYVDRVDSTGLRFAPSGAFSGFNVQGPVGDDARFGMFGAHLQVALPLTRRLDVIAGSRHTRVRAKVGRYQDPASGAAANFSDHWARTVHSVRGMFALQEGGRQQLWAGISQAFRAPNIADVSRFGASRSSETEIAATDLAPEDFLTYELGWKTRGPALTTSVALFHTRIRDYIASTPTGRLVDGQIEVSKRNSAGGHVQGLELAGDYALPAHWSFHAHLAWQAGELDHFPNTLADAAVREPLSRVMPLTANLRVDWQTVDGLSWWSCGLTLSGDADRLSAGDRADTERIPPGGTSGYTVFNVRAGHALTPHVSVVAGVENVFDTAYRTHGSGSNEAGLGATVGVTVAF